jgi:hypothetical protein
MRYYPSTYLVGLRKTTKNLNKNRNPIIDLNLYLPEYAIKEK